MEFTEEHWQEIKKVANAIGVSVTEIAESVRKLNRQVNYSASKVEELGRLAASIDKFSIQERRKNKNTLVNPEMRRYKRDGFNR